jgi:hypothetical protein
MAKKFVTLNFRCGADYLNADWIYDLVVAYYIAKFNLKSCQHVSLSVGAFTALMWKFGSNLYTGAPAPLSSEELALIHDFIQAGAGLIYDESTSSITEFPEPQITEKRLNPIPEFPSLTATMSFEDFVNAACRRYTEAYDPFTGEKLLNDDDYRYGIDAAHEYLMKVGHPTAVQHKVVICKSSLVNWIAAWLCGVERGEFGGPCPFGPNTLPQDLDKNNDPEKIWLDSYVDDFAETPFFWICGLLTFIPIKNLGEHDTGVPNKDSAITNLDEVRIDDNQQSWCFPTMVERAQWLINYLKNVSPIAAKRIGAFITSKDCHAKKSDWLVAFEEPGRKVPHYEKFNIPSGTHIKPSTLAEAHLASSEMGDENGVYGAWKAQFEAFLDYIEDVWFDDPDIILFSDREAKDMVVQQYDHTNPPITVDEDRLKAIVDYLINANNWNNELEWQVEDVSVRRPPDYVKITIDEEYEYYSLSEAYFHMLSALNDIANEEETINYKALEPVLGPCEPSVCPVTTVDSIDEDDSVYRVFVWWQHDMEIMPDFSYETILAQMPALFQASFTELIGPNFPDTSRQKRLRKVISLWDLTDDLNHGVKLNAAEIMYLLAKTLAYYYDSEHQPETYQHLPSHILPKSYYKFLSNGRFKLIFGEINQLNWLDLGQRWTLKPAILQEAYK